MKSEERKEKGKGVLGRIEAERKKRGGEKE